MGRLCAALRWVVKSHPGYKVIARCSLSEQPVANGSCDLLVRHAEQFFVHFKVVLAEEGCRCVRLQRSFTKNGWGCVKLMATDPLVFPPNLPTDGPQVVHLVQYNRACYVPCPPPLPQPEAAASLVLRLAALPRHREFRPLQSGGSAGLPQKPAARLSQNRERRWFRTSAAIPDRSGR